LAPATKCKAAELSFDRFGETLQGVSRIEKSANYDSFFAAFFAFFFFFIFAMVVVL
jgi:hypothetical protein